LIKQKGTEIFGAFFRTWTNERLTSRRKNGKRVQNFLFSKILVLIWTSSLIFFKNYLKNNYKMYLFIYLLSWLFAKKVPKQIQIFGFFSKKPKIIKRHVYLLFLLLLFQICEIGGWWVGEHAQEELAKFGLRSEGASNKL